MLWKNCELEKNIWNLSDLSEINVNKTSTGFIQKLKKHKQIFFAISTITMLEKTIHIIASFEI